MDLREFFYSKTNGVNQDRYVPKGYSVTGGGWGVWDRKESRYIEGKELKQLDYDALMNEKLMSN